MDKKKIVAAVAAVTAYIRTEEEAAAYGIAQGLDTHEPEARVKFPPAALNIWGASGRQAIMHMRSLMQIKSFHGSKLR